MKSAYCLLKMLNENIAFFPIAYFEYYFLELPGIPEKQRIRFDGQIVKASSRDIEELAQQFSHKALKFRERFNRGQIILVARDVEGRIVGYENLDLSSAHHEEHSGIDISIPAHSIYLFDAFILPQYRFKGVWIGFKNLVADIMAEQKRTRLFTFVENKNIPSLKSHLQYGFKIYEKKQIWKVFGHPFCSTVALQHNLELIKGLLKT